MNEYRDQGALERTIGFFGALGIGVGAMVGGGILALAGVAFAATGPSAVLAFALNGLIALITALSFAEMASAYPQSGGAYTYAKKALSLQVAFGVGWIVWFASLVAATLYALGFGAFATFALLQFDSAWLGEVISIRAMPVLLALSATLLFGFRLLRNGGSEGNYINIGKLLVFAILIAAGLAVVVQTPFPEIRRSFDPFFSGGFSGLIAAMGYTFIALQGFDLIASSAGEIRQPEKNLPRAMVGTLAVGLAVYLPLLFVMMTVGVQPGSSITELSRENPETVLAVAAQNYMGAFGFWLVLVAGIFSMLSALQANLFAASRIVLRMSNDRTLSYRLSYIDPKRSTPVTAISVTTGIVVLLVVLLPDVAAAGAASSLIFLLTFALGHLIMILLRKRSYESSDTYRAPFYPWLPITGLVSCLGLALFQAAVVPSAGVIAAVWLFGGSILFILFFVRRAEVVDASEQALNPGLTRLRGLNPLVLVPIANPANAESMVLLASALAPPVTGRVLLLSIITPGEDPDERDRRLVANREVTMQALQTSFVTGISPETLTTSAKHPWNEIERVAMLHQCRILLLGLSDLSDEKTHGNLEKLVSRIVSDVVVFRQPYTGWNIRNARKILIPVGGMGNYDPLRARLAATLWRETQPEITFVRILPESSSELVRSRSQAELIRFSRRIIPGESEAKIVINDDVGSELVSLSSGYDLVIMGLGKQGSSRREFGSIAMALVNQTDSALVFISQK